MKYTANATMAAMANAVLRTTILIRVRNTPVQFMVLRKYHKFGCLCHAGAQLSNVGKLILQSAISVPTITMRYAMPCA